MKVECQRRRRFRSGPRSRLENEDSISALPSCPVHPHLQLSYGGNRLVCAHASHAARRPAGSGDHMPPLHVDELQPQRHPRRLLRELSPTGQAPRPRRWPGSPPSPGSLRDPFRRVHHHRPARGRVCDGEDQAARNDEAEERREPRPGVRLLPRCPPDGEGEDDDEDGGTGHAAIVAVLQDQINPHRAERHPEDPAGQPSKSNPALPLTTSSGCHMLEA